MYSANSDLEVTLAMVPKWFRACTQWDAAPYRICNRSDVGWRSRWKQMMLKVGTNLRTSWGDEDGDYWKSCVVINKVLPPPGTRELPYPEGGWLISVNRFFIFFQAFGESSETVCCNSCCERKHLLGSHHPRKMGHETTGVRILILNSAAIGRLHRAGGIALSAARLKNPNIHSSWKFNEKLGSP